MIIGVLLMVIFYLIYQVSRPKKPPNENYKKEINKRDSLIEDKERYIEFLEGIKAKSGEDRAVVEGERKQKQIGRSDNEKKTEKINQQYDEIPITTNTLTKDELRRKFAEFNKH